MFPIETISARMLDYYVGRNDALISEKKKHMPKVMCGEL